MYVLKGKIKGKKYVSRKTFRTQEGAVAYGYKLTYTKGGNKKKKGQLTDWYVAKK